MKIARWNLIMAGVILSSLLMGCSHVHDRVGTKVTLYPVTSTLKLDVTNYRSAQVSIDHFIAHHNKLVVTQMVELKYRGKAGLRLADYTRNALLKLGVAKEHVHLLASDMASDSFLILLTDYKVKTSQCHYANYHSLSQFTDDHGCSVESNRWLSMTNPERSASISMDTQ
ncbi:MULTISPECIES: hypothetical protein [Vibrio]|uniref:Lipoprotein n=2 Tax=Vibrio TaxID=662 RepID=A0A7X4LPW5_9VIBR|nr:MULTISPECIES: hypothetical protein [Vibrio]MBF9002226.1 hypothetical protein [Vibrio nitrifigilis]MZI96013.1 hypothetical protein [Vibrio eleionomae]